MLVIAVMYMYMYSMSFTNPTDYIIVCVCFKSYDPERLVEMAKHKCIFCLAYLPVKAVPIVRMAEDVGCSGEKNKMKQNKRNAANLRKLWLGLVMVLKPNHAIFQI